jgi:GNAT superfamily N-acetyltransferase
VILRPATSDDAAAIAVLHRKTVRESLPFLPDLHTAQEDFGYFSERFLPANTVWVAEREGQVVAYVGFDADWINHLYVLPEAQGQGIGPALLAKALKDGRRRRLWAFQRNTRARAFYEARGFVMVRLADGQGNQEREPDVLYEWRGPAEIKRGL